MFALLLRAFRDFDDIRRCYKPVVLNALLQMNSGKFLFACGLRRAEWFSSSSPAAGLRRAIFRGIFFGGLFVFDD